MWRNVGCWDSGNASLEKCGAKLPSAPQNLTVISIPVDEAHVMLSINWEPPVICKPTVKAYKIVINDNNTHFINYTAHQHNVTMSYFNITLPTLHEYVIKVF